MIDIYTKSFHSSYRRLNTFHFKGFDYIAMSTSTKISIHTYLRLMYRHNVGHQLYTAHDNIGC